MNFDLIISGQETLELILFKKLIEQIEKYKKIMNSRNGAAKSNETR